MVSKELAKDEVIKATHAIELKIPTIVQESVTSELEKVKTMQRNEAQRFRHINLYNERQDPDRKIGSDVPFSYLRRMAQMYPIARACINYRIRQITQLTWDITTIDEIDGEDVYKEQIDYIKQFLKTPMGHKTRFREMLTVMVDDILTVDALSFEYQKTRGGEFLHLIPVDPTTIVLRVTETGGTPEPPELAYEQYIQGQRIAGFTTDELLYEAMSNRSYSPYGMAPLESLILQVQGALKGALYNLAYFNENNVPDGFLTLPDEVATSKNQVEEWQMWFDAMVAGDTRFMHRLKILPGGSEYTAAKKPEDMAFERFELWILQQTCAMFDVPPQAIGITYQVNKATGQSQQDISKEKGLVPLANFFKEILDDVIQYNMGFPELQFMWTNLNPKDRKTEVELAEKEIKMGAKSVDEYRVEQGLEPLGLEHFILAGNTPIMVKDIVSGKYQEDQQKEKEQSALARENSNESRAKKMEMDEIRKWKKVVMKDLEMGRKIRTRFPTELIRPEIHKEIELALSEVNSKQQAKLVFDEYLIPSMSLMKYATELRELEHDLSS